MPYTIEKKNERTLIKIPSNGVKVFDVDVDDVSKFKWDSDYSYISIYDSGRIIYFKVIIAKFEDQEKRDILFIKPFEKYENFTFQEIFGFKGRCSDYNENKVVGLRK